MSQRVSRGNGLVADSNPPSRRRRVWTAFKNAIAGFFSDSDVRPVTARPQIQCLESRQLLSATLFVAPWGSDNSAGTITAPFKTIQHAASIAEPGDKVEIRAGTYRETVTPAHSGTASQPITFEAYDGENVTISGANPITGWSNYKGAIADAPMSWDLGEGNNEIFVGTQALTEARWPNTSIYDPSHPATETIQKLSGSPGKTTIYDSNLNQPAGYWTGAIIHIAPGQAWDGQTGVVTASQPGSITISYTYHSSYAVLQPGNTFYLFGKFQALDSAGEWYRDPTTGKLYVWAPNGASPASQDIEAKERQFAFNLNGVSNITINNVNIFASTITTSAVSKGVVINGISAKYVSQDMVTPHGWWDALNDGIMLKGVGDVIENSTVQYASGEAIVVTGAGSTVENNIVEDAVYNANNVGAIQVWASNVKIDHNTVANSGRHGIDAEVSHVTITNNYVHDVGLQTTEAGGIYSGGINGEGSVIAYNVIANIHTGGWGGTALFLDQGSSNWTVHNNITTNVDYGMKVNFTSNDNDIYNNTLGATKLAVDTNQQGNWDGTSVTDNVFLSQTVFTKGAKIAGNVYSATTSTAVGAGKLNAGASGVKSTVPVITTPPVTTPPVTTPPVHTPPATTPSAKTTIEAVDYTSISGLKGDNFTGLGYAYNNDWASYKLDFGAGVTKLTAGIAAIHGNGTIQIHEGSVTGTLVGTLKVGVTGAWNKYTSQSAAISSLKGVQTVYLVFKGTAAGIANINSLKFS